MENKKAPSQLYNFSDSPSGSHMKIIELVGSGKRVLDVGCNKGYLSKAFKGSGGYVVGIESDLESAEIAEQFCDKVIIVDLDRIEDLNLDKYSFDVIVFADILEHLKNPEKAVLKLKEYLKPEGKIIVSVPNVGRIDIRLKLLFGRFDYQDSGIMDRNHLRFFTIKTAKRLLADCGLMITDVFYTGLANKMQIFLNLLAFQFIIVAKPR